MHTNVNDSIFFFTSVGHLMYSLEYAYTNLETITIEAIIQYCLTVGHCG